MTVGRVLVTVLLLLVIVATTIRALGLDRGFPVSAVMTVYPYVVLLGAAATLGALAIRARPEILVGGATFAIGLTLLLPRALPGPTPSSPPTGTDLVVAVANLREGNGRAASVVEAVDAEAVDVLVALEVTRPSVDALDAAGLDRRLPHATVLPSRFTSGGGIWSRHPLQAREPSRLRGFGATPHATIDVPGHGPLDVDAVHPLPPINAAWTQSWARMLEALPPPTEGTSRRLLAGDFNATLDHHAFRDVLARGWVDAADADGAGLRPTFNGLRDGVLVPPVTLDHVLVDRTVAVEAVSTRPLPGSDHRILIVRLRLPAP